MPQRKPTKSTMSVESTSSDGEPALEIVSPTVAMRERREELERARQAAASNQPAAQTPEDRIIPRTYPATIAGAAPPEAQGKGTTSRSAKTTPIRISDDNEEEPTLRIAVELNMAQRRETKAKEEAADAKEKLARARAEIQKLKTQKRELKEQLREARQEAREAKETADTFREQCEIMSNLYEG